MTCLFDKDPAHKRVKYIEGGARRDQKGEQLVCPLDLFEMRIDVNTWTLSGPTRIVKMSQHLYMHSISRGPE